MFSLRRQKDLRNKMATKNKKHAGGRKNTRKIDISDRGGIHLVLTFPLGRKGTSQ